MEKWQLSPAFDVAYAYNPGGEWTDRHQMSLNGKRDSYVRDDLIAFGRTAGLKAGRVADLLDAVRKAVANWPDHADQAGVSAAHKAEISAGLRHDALE